MNERYSKPLVTVLIPTYNRAHRLSPAIESVLGQTYSNYELIIIRDGGEPVEFIVRKFSDPRIHFIDRSENCGKPASLNEALQQARGKYVCYLDDDDRWYPFHVEVLVTALEAHPEYGAAYTDLYKVHCRCHEDGRRTVLAKNVEISRDFDRINMLYFNLALHVSLMHRRDLLEQAGPYNENLNILIDWDLTRRLCFYTDFLHLPVVTGEFFAPVEDNDRISVQHRKEPKNYAYNLMTIRSTRPAKPWPKIRDLSVILLYDRADEILQQSLRDLWGHSFYPHAIYLPLLEPDFELLRRGFPNLVRIPAPTQSSLAERVDQAIRICDGEFIALVPAGMAIPSEEISFLERSLNPLLVSDERNAAYELVESDEVLRGAVFRSSELRQARQKYPSLPLWESITAAGIQLRKPTYEQYPFQLDNILSGLTGLCQNGDWKRAAEISKYCAAHHGNEAWMRTLQANALYWDKCIDESQELLDELNVSYPSVARLMIQARCHTAKGHLREAVQVYRRAEAILDGNEYGYTAEQLEALLGTLNNQTELSVGP